MRDIILACVGVVIAIAGCIYLAVLLYYKKFGVTAKAEVLDVSEVERKVGFIGHIVRTTKRVSHYTHTMKYEVNGKAYKEKDSAAYSRPLKTGSTHLILCEPKNPKKFRFEENVDSHIRIAAALAVMGVIFAVRFFYTYMK